MTTTPVEPGQVRRGPSGTRYGVVDIHADGRWATVAELSDEVGVGGRWIGGDEFDTLVKDLETWPHER